MRGREFLLILILGIFAYMVWLLWQLWRMRRKPPAPAARRVREPTLAARDEAETDHAEFNRHLREQLRVRFHRRSPQSGEQETEETPDAPTGNKAEEVGAEESSAHFAEQAFMDGVERELAQVQEEVDALRGALAALREDLLDLREEFRQESQAARAAQNASPLYGDAMQMAILGHDALTIAERCGIARAEAELVVSLVKNKETNPR
ncbi:MAG: DUF2802 domain-containing protein [Zoogloeaceae bacterium]|jgi:hypothetical protein|nr:DUF2802 domain-containing protein [Zoogloeaceae bacterium]